jgi:putative endonuclease
MTEARRRTGSAAEALVARRLQAASWELVERNARTRYGELDIVALDGATLVFLEVKAGREGAGFGPERPVHSVGPRKQRQVRRLATAWLAERRGLLPRYAEIRFDAVGVTFTRAGEVEIEHLEGAF